MKPMADVLETLREKGVTAADSVRLFGREAGPGIATVLALSKDEYAAYTARVYEVGAAAAMAEVQMKSLPGAFKLLSSAWEALNLAVVNGGSFINSFIRTLAELLGWLATDIVPAMQDTYQVFNDLFSIDINPFTGQVTRMGAGIKALSPILSILGDVINTVSAAWNAAGNVDPVIASMTKLSGTATVLKEVFEAVGEGFDLFQEQAVEVKNIVIEMFESFDNDKASKLAEIFDDAVKAIKPFIPEITAAVTWLVAIGGTLAVLSPIVGILTAITAGVVSLAGAFLLNPISLALIAIGVAAYELYQNWDEIWDAIGVKPQVVLEKIQAAWDVFYNYVSGIFTQVYEAFDAAWTRIEAIFENKSITEGFSENLGDILLVVSKLILDLLVILGKMAIDLAVAMAKVAVALVGAFITHLPEILVFLGKLSIQIIDALSDLVVYAVQEVAKMGVQMAAAVGAWIGDVVGKFVQLGADALKAVETWVFDLIADFVSLGPKLATATSGGLSGILESFVQIGKDVIAWVTEFASEMVTKFLKMGGDLIQAVKDGVTGLPAAVAEVTGDAVQAVGDTIEGSFNFLKDAGANFYNYVVDGTNEALDRKELEEAGKESTQQYSDGILIEINTARSAAEDVGVLVGQTLNSAANDPAIETAGGEVSTNFSVGISKTGAKIETASENAGILASFGFATGVSSNADLVTKSAEEIAEAAQAPLFSLAAANGEAYDAGQAVTDAFAAGLEADYSAVAEAAGGASEAASDEFKKLAEAAEIVRLGLVESEEAARAYELSLTSLSPAEQEQILNAENYNKARAQQNDLDEEAKQLRDDQQKAIDDLNTETEILNTLVTDGADAALRASVIAEGYTGVMIDQRVEAIKNNQVAEESTRAHLANEAAMDSLAIQQAVLTEELTNGADAARIKYLILNDNLTPAEAKLRVETEKSIEVDKAKLKQIEANTKAYADFASGLADTIVQADSIKDAFNDIGDYLENWLLEQIKLFATNQIKIALGVDTEGSDDLITQLFNKVTGNDAADAAAAADTTNLPNLTPAQSDDFLTDFGTSNVTTGAGVLDASGNAIEVADDFVFSEAASGAASGASTAAAGAAGAVNYGAIASGIAASVGTAIAVYVATELVTNVLPRLADSLFGTSFETVFEGIEFNYIAGNTTGQAVEVEEREAGFFQGTESRTTYTELSGIQEAQLRQLDAGIDGVLDGVTTTFYNIGGESSKAILDGFSIENFRVSAEDIGNDFADALIGVTNEAYALALTNSDPEVLALVNSRTDSGDAIYDLETPQDREEIDRIIKEAFENSGGGLGSTLDDIGEALEDVDANAEIAREAIEEVAFALGTVAPALESAGAYLGEGLFEVGTNALLFVDELGGMEAALEKTAFVMQNIAPASIALQASIDGTNAQLVGFDQTVEEAGGTAIRTTAGLWEYIGGLDLTTEAGRKAAAQAYNSAEAILVQERALAEQKQTTDLVVDSLGIFGFNLDGADESTIALAGSIADAAGGFDNLAAQMDYFFANFYTEAEQTEISAESASGRIAALNAELGLTGDSAIRTAADFRDFVENLDPMSEGYAEIRNTLFETQDAFIILGDIATERAQETVDAAVEAADAYNEALRESIDAQIDAAAEQADIAYAAAEEQADIAREAANNEADAAREAAQERADIATEAAEARADAARDAANAAATAEKEALQERAAAQIEALEEQAEYAREAAIATHEVNVGMIQLHDISLQLGLGFDKTNPSARATTQALIELYGGLDQVTAALNNYYDKFYSEEEKSTITKNQSLAQLKVFNDELGLSGSAAIDTKAELREYTDGLLAQGPAGAAALKGALDVADSLLVVADSGQSLEEGIGNIPPEFQAMYDGMLLSAAEGTEDQISELDKQLEARLEGIDAQLEADKQAIQDQLEADQEAVDRKLEAQLAGIDAQLEADKKAIQDQLDADNEAIDRRLEAQLQGIEAELEAKKAAIDYQFEQTVAALEAEYAAKEQHVDEEALLEAERQKELLLLQNEFFDDSLVEQQGHARALAIATQGSQEEEVIAAKKHNNDLYILAVNNKTEVIRLKEEEAAAIEQEMQNMNLNVALTGQEMTGTTLRHFEGLQEDLDRVNGEIAAAQETSAIELAAENEGYQQALLDAEKASHLLLKAENLKAAAKELDLTKDGNQDIYDEYIQLADDATAEAQRLNDDVGDYLQDMQEAGTDEAGKLKTHVISELERMHEDAKSPMEKLHDYMISVLSKVTRTQEEIDATNAYAQEQSAKLTQAAKDAGFYNEDGSHNQEAFDAARNVDGSHALGLYSVPFSGYIAELHANERILTAAEAARYNQLEAANELDYNSSSSSNVTPIITPRPANQSNNDDVVNEIKQLRKEMMETRDMNEKLLKQNNMLTQDIARTNNEQVGVLNTQVKQDLRNIRRAEK